MIQSHFFKNVKSIHKVLIKTKTMQLKILRREKQKALQECHDPNMKPTTK